MDEVGGGTDTKVEAWCRLRNRLCKRYETLPNYCTGKCTSACDGP